MYTEIEETNLEWLMSISNIAEPVNFANEKDETLVATSTLRNRVHTLSVQIELLQ